jgi:uncharacterized protein (TIGR03086 family)
MSEQRMTAQKTGNGTVAGRDTADQDVLAEAHRVLRDAVAGVGERDWTRSTPCDQWNVTQVLQHAAGDQLAYAAAVTGHSGPPFDPFAPSGQLTGPPLAFLDHAIQASAQAWGTVAAGAREVPSPLPQGALPAETWAGACALDAAVHAWDIAVATGQRPQLPAALARSLMSTAAAIAEPLRAYGAYAPALNPAATDGDLESLLRYLGRDPHWAPPA